MDCALENTTGCPGVHLLSLVVVFTVIFFSSKGFPETVNLIILRCSFAEDAKEMY